MKAKTVRSVIAKKVDEWIASIDDEPLREQLKKSVIVTGGCIASMLLREKVNDFDIYFRDADTAEKTARYYVNKFSTKQHRGIDVDISVKVDAAGRIKIVAKSAGIASDGGAEKPYEYFELQPDTAGGEYVQEVMQDPGAIQDVSDEISSSVSQEGEKYRPVFLSTNAITLSSGVQLVLRFYGEPEEIHKYYDFIHCTNHWTSWDGGKLYLNQPALESLLSKELRYVGSKYPICSMFRVRKFINRGWTINAGQMLKMAWQVSELDLSNLDVLEDQLTGVDVAYFVQLVERLRESDPEKVNAAYLVEIIDRMF